MKKKDKKKVKKRKHETKGRQEIKEKKARKERYKVWIKKLKNNYPVMAHLISYKSGRINTVKGS
jgi:hypothetical protein